MRTRRRGPKELVRTNGEGPPIAAGYVSAAVYTATCICGAWLDFVDGEHAVTCRRCGALYKVRPRKVA